MVTPPAPPLEGAALLPASEVPERMLADFYRAVFPDRRTDEVWRWQYRWGFRPGRVPLAVVQGGRVIAHAGMTPFHLDLDGRAWRGDWYVDFATLPEVRGRGLGKLCTRAWMEGTDIGLACGCTPGSRAVFAKCGWQESPQSYLHYFLLRPLDHPRLVARLPAPLRGAGNLAAWPAAKLAWRLLGARLAAADLRPVDPAFAVRFTAPPAATAGVARARHDGAFYDWRIGASPHRDAYRVLEVDGLVGLVKPVDRDGVRSLDLLWLSDPARHAAVRRLVGALARFGLREGFSFVRFFTSDPDLSRALARRPGSLVRRPVFAFWAADPDLAARFAAARWTWDMLDSDFERI